MASSSRPRSSSSDSRSRRGRKQNTGTSSRARRSSVKARQGKGVARVQRANKALQSSENAQRQARESKRQMVDKGRRAGDIRAEQRAKRQRRQYLRYIARIAIAIAIILLVIFGSIFIYRSDLFHVNNVQVNGSEHLTSQEITIIAAVSDYSTLLRLYSKGIKERLEDNAWVQEAAIHRVFPDTIVIDITEREPAAVAKINDKSNWVISTDGAWLSASTTDYW